MADKVFEFAGVSVRRDGATLLDSITWSVESGQRWVVLGPNGAGKTTLLQVAGALMQPTSGTATLLGEQLGRVDVFDLRSRIGISSTALAHRLPDTERVRDVVMTAAYAITGRWNESYDDIDERQAMRVLREWNLDHVADRPFAHLSDGEKKRVQIARAIMTDPELLLLDEPAASLDLGAREELLQLLSAYAHEQSAPALVMVTHHLEEIPAGFTHALLLKAGSIVAAGQLDDVLTTSLVSDTFGIPIDVRKADGRYSAVARAVEQKQVA